MLNRDVKEIISAFNAANVEYLIVGVYAVAAHGLPRTTGDIDFWVRPTHENAERVAVRDFSAIDMIAMDGVTAQVIGREHLLRNKRAVGRPRVDKRVRAIDASSRLTAYVDRRGLGTVVGPGAVIFRRAESRAGCS